ncbi:transposase [Ruminococcus sp.]|uniref:transposase n=1 Tax=Ruminococcus sp. TaxID=41978 RepID=UPI00339047B0|nr:transposase [Ruminococcus sp.]
MIHDSKQIEQLCKRDIHFMWLLDGFGAPDHSTISRFRQKMGEQIERVFYAKETRRWLYRISSKN